jgi:hypothetical protein
MTDRERIREATAVGLDPLMEKRWWEILLDLPKRFLAMLSKLLGVKGVVLGLTVWLGLRGTFGEAFPYVFVIICGVVIFGREFLKFIKDVKK